nr:glycosyltransferase [Lachnospiraceae bacterium]
PIRFMSGVGVTFFIGAVLMMIYVLIEKFTVGTPILGWASLMCVVLFSFGLMMLMLGILGEYVWRALDASRNRPPYLIDEIKKSDEK